MNIELEHRLHRDLPEMATRADVATVELAGVMGRVGRRRRRRAVARTATAVAGVVLVVGGLVAVSTRGGSDDLDAASPDAGPTRTEVPLVRLATVPAPLMRVVRPDPVGFELANGEQLIFSVGATAYFDTYNQSHCRQLAGFGSCWTVPADAEVEAMPWTDLELAGTAGSVMWIGLPAVVDVVELRQGDAVMWQHVIDGVAAFPVAEMHPTDEYVALDAAGLEVMRTTWSTVELSGEGNRVLPGGTLSEIVSVWSSTFVTAQSPFVPVVDATILEGMTQADEEAYRAFADATMRQCLVDQGAAAWNGCLVSTEAAVKAYLADRP